MAFAEKAKQIMIAALAVISLSASSVSACNCSHHVEQTQNEEPSCHSHSHQTNSAAKSNSLTSADAPCECLLLKTAPAIIAKSEREKTRVQKQIGDAVAQPGEFELQHAAVTNVIAAVSSAPSTHLPRYFTGLLPSRAPPRL